MHASSHIRQHINKIALGKPFLSSIFLKYGKRATIDQTLSRLVKSGFIERVARGVFVRPKKNAFIGTVPPTPFKIAETVAKTVGAKISINGAEALRRFGLSTQTPTQAVFYTEGPTRKLKFGKLKIIIKHVSPRKLVLAHRPAGQAITALWYLGKRGITKNIVEQIIAKLEPSELKALHAAQATMPSWMSDAVVSLKQT
ncbi:MAG: type IV toxin-antitoxin system AbiEi family antitoxin domain-containing protein [Deltaproteobacteria bacterium]|nr:type IV toxin-antitoxin system AbiEi family antitoxin domain-containing protein [Deltaproteobacteria bacterium]